MSATSRKSLMEIEHIFYFSSNKLCWRFLPEIIFSPFLFLFLLLPLSSFIVSILFSLFVYIIFLSFFFFVYRLFLYHTFFLLFFSRFPLSYHLSSLLFCFSLSTSFLLDYLSYLLFVFSFSFIILSYIITSFFPSFPFRFCSFPLSSYPSPFLFFIFRPLSLSCHLSFLLLFLLLLYSFPFHLLPFFLFPHFLLFSVIFTFLDRKYLKYYVCTRGTFAFNWSLFTFDG